MGTGFEVISSARDLHILPELEQYAHELEKLWTRFNATSELMALNVNAGKFIQVSNETAQLVSEMRRGFFVTDGLFNAGVLMQMQEAGFTSAEFESRITPKSIAEFQELWNTVEIHEQAVCLPIGLAIDAGGIGKGLAADFIAARAMNSGVQGIVVNAGGEVAVRGESVNPYGWSVAVEDPFDEAETLAIVRLESGGLATSSPRGWVINGKSHIIDPRTNESTQTEIVQATVLSGRTVDAEVLTKMCLLMPAGQSIAKIESLGAAAYIVDSSKNIFQTTNWSNFQ